MSGSNEPCAGRGGLDSGDEEGGRLDEGLLWYSMGDDGCVGDSCLGAGDAFVAGARPLADCAFLLFSFSLARLNKKSEFYE